MTRARAGLSRLEAADTAAFDALAARPDARGVKVRRTRRALADERHLADLIVFEDPSQPASKCPLTCCGPGQTISGSAGARSVSHGIQRKEAEPLSFYRDLRCTSRVQAALLVTCPRHLPRQRPVFGATSPSPRVPVKVPSNCKPLVR